MGFSIRSRAVVPIVAAVAPEVAVGALLTAACALTLVIQLRHQSGASDDITDRDLVALQFRLRRAADQIQHKAAIVAQDVMRDYQDAMRAIGNAHAPLVCSEPHAAPTALYSSYGQNPSLTSQQILDYLREQSARNAETQSETRDGSYMGPAGATQYDSKAAQKLTQKFVDSRGKMKIGCNDVRNILHYVGFTLDRQNSSHEQWSRENTRSFTVACHRDEADYGLLKDLHRVLMGTW